MNVKIDRRLVLVYLECRENDAEGPILFIVVSSGDVIFAIVS